MAFSRKHRVLMPATSKSDLGEIIDRDGFVARHVGPSSADLMPMLQTIGVASVEHLIDDTVPDTIRARVPLDLGPPLSEMEVLQKLRRVAGKNRKMTSLIGQGYYGTILPPV